MIRKPCTRTCSIPNTLRSAVLVASALCTWPAAASTEPSAAGPGSAQQQIDALTQQLKAVQEQMKELAQQNQALQQKQQEILQQMSKNASAGAAVVAAPPQNPPPPSLNPVPPSSNPTPPAPPGPAVSAGNSSPLGDLKLWGYGEIYYTRPTHDVTQTQSDLARAVFGIGYVFDSLTEFNSEFEVEHAVSSAEDPGEFEVEQFYVDRKLNDAITLRAGLFLMPFGLLNEHHEPTNFYGVQRNFVETLIIPSTWREGGFNLHGDTDIGFSWNVGLTTGFDLSKWDFAPEFPLYTNALSLETSGSAPLQATHQELALANAQHLSQYVALGYYGVPGLTLGAAISTGDAVKVPAPPNAPIPGNQRVTLWEGHARWTPGNFDLSALYAHGSISNLEIANASNPGSPNPIPSDFYGYFLQGAYTAWNQGNYRLAPFVRWETYNMGSSYQGSSGPVVPPGLVPISANPGDYGYWPINHDRVWTLGANFYTSPHLVFKIDYQWFDQNTDFNRLDLGMGLAF
jgi:Phosphate-selective porin O and P